MTSVLAELRPLARKLLWSAATIDQLEQSCTSTQADFLAQAMRAEITTREQAKRERLARRAGFPAPKSFDGYDWTHVALPQRLTREDITSCQFAQAKQNLVLYGPVGTGKTHLATAIGQTACEIGIPVRFETVSALTVRLAEAKDDHALTRTVSSLLKHDIIILDEFGYVPLDRDAARLLYQIVAECYETRSLVLTTNVPFSRWGPVLTDDQMAAAMIDRIAHHGHLIPFDGDSYRIRHALMRGTE
jgi:DNA replication protein DnaC